MFNTVNIFCSGISLLWTDLSVGLSSGEFSSSALVSQIIQALQPQIAQAVQSAVQVQAQVGTYIEILIIWQKGFKSDLCLLTAFYSFLTLSMSNYDRFNLCVSSKHIFSNFSVFILLEDVFLQKLYKYLIILFVRDIHQLCLYY